LLRITKIFENADSVILKLEGRIISDWVTVLEQECLKWFQEKQQALLDFSEVTFIDNRGVEMLKRVLSPKVQCLNCPPFIEEMLKGNEEHSE